MDNWSGHCFSAHYKSKPKGSPVWSFSAVWVYVYQALCLLCVASVPLHTIRVTAQHSPRSTRAVAEELGSQLEWNHKTFLCSSCSVCQTLWRLTAHSPCETLFHNSAKLRTLLVWYRILTHNLVLKEGLIAVDTGKSAGWKDRGRLSSDEPAYTCSL